MKRFIPYLLIAIISILTFWKLSQTFYQQDEWAAIGLFLSKSLWTSLKGIPILEMIGGRNRILGVILLEIFYRYFVFNISAQAYFAIVLHTLNAFLVYKIVRKLGMIGIQALVASIFFVLCYSSHQSVTWLATTFTLLPSILFFLLSFIVFQTYIKKPTVWNLFFSYLCFIISFLFKEQSIILLLLFPLIFLLESKKKKVMIKQLIITMVPMIIFIGFIVIVRLMSGQGGTTGGLFVTGGVQATEKILFHAFFYPFTALSQVFVPQYLMINISTAFSNINYGFLKSQEVEKRVVEFIVSDYLSTVIAFFILIGSSTVYLLQKNQRRALIFGVALIMVSMLPYAILDRGGGYLDSRYFYIAAMGGGIVFSVWIQSLYQLMRKKCYLSKEISFVIVMIIVLGIFYKYSLFIRRDIDRGIIVAKEREGFLSSLKNMYPKLPKKIIFYISGDNTSYYYVTNMAVTFQQGPGYTIMAWYYRGGTIPSELLRDGFLWGMLDEGYKEIDGRGFGYFWNKDHLSNYLKENSVSSHVQIIGLYYNSGSHRIDDITNEIKNYH